MVFIIIFIRWLVFIIWSVSHSFDTLYFLMCQWAFIVRRILVECWLGRRFLLAINLWGFCMQKVRLAS